jgi:DUF917 family protein
MKIESGMLQDFARGAAFLGTGGGGDPYIGRLCCAHAITTYGPPELIPLQALADDANVFSVAGMGAPTVLVEKMFSLEEAHLAVSKLESFMGRRADAIIAAECGGINATLPVAYAAMRGLPIVDADGMGRAFPAIHMVSFNVYGVPCTPMVITNEHGESAIIEASNAKAAEELGRPLVVQMGASAMLSCYPMTGAEAKRTAVAATLSAAYGIGRAIAEGRKTGMPVEALLAYLRTTPYYRHAYRLFDGKIVDVQRETTRGWVLGRCVLEALADPRNRKGKEARLEIQFQNENLCAWRNGRVVAIVPDLIVVVDRETAEPITTEGLRYGQRVSVVGVSAPPIMRTSEALAVFGPQAFDLPSPFVPVERLTHRQENPGENT